MGAKRTGASRWSRRYSVTSRPSSVATAQGVRRILRSPTFYTVIRLGQVGVLAIGALVLAGLLRVSQYALYGRGALFSSAFSAIYLFGQDQLSYQRRLRLRTFRWRALLVQGAVGLVVGTLRVSSTPRREWVLLGSSCLGTAAMVITSATWVSLQSEG